jgi:uncharacterized protein involved in exopolysaccharide biosynthesis
VGGGGHGGVPAFQMTGSDVWRVFRTNWWLILGLVAVMAVAGFFLNGYLVKHHPKFRANGLVKVQLPEEVFREGEDLAASPPSIELEQKTQARGMLQPACC